MKKNCYCGAEYEIIEFHCSMRDKDSLECDFCGKTLLKWNGAVFYIKKLIAPPTSCTQEMSIDAQEQL